MLMNIIINPVMREQLSPKHDLSNEVQSNLSEMATVGREKRSLLGAGLRTEDVSAKATNEIGHLTEVLLITEKHFPLLIGITVLRRLVCHRRSA